MNIKKKVKCMPRKQQEAILQVLNVHADQTESNLNDVEKLVGFLDLSPDDMHDCVKGIKIIRDKLNSFRKSVLIKEFDTDELDVYKFISYSITGSYRR